MKGIAGVQIASFRKLASDVTLLKPCSEDLHATEVDTVGLWKKSGSSEEAVVGNSVSHFLTCV